MKIGIVVSALSFLVIAQSLKTDVREGRWNNGIVLRGISGQAKSGRILKHSKKDDIPSTPEPTPTPTPAPTLTEPISDTLAPTLMDLWNVVTDANGFVISTCKVLPEGSAATSMFSEVLEFDYYLYLSETEVEDIEVEMDTVEVKLHEALTERALPCSFDGVDTIVAALSSEGADTLLGECQDATPETLGSCWHVRAQVTMVMSSTLSSPELFAMFFQWIEESLATAANGNTTLTIEFRGFPNGDVDAGKVLPGSDVTQSSGNVLTTSAVQGNVPLNEPPSRPLGPFVVAIAATVLVLLTAFLVHRHKRRQRAFNAQAREEVSVISLDGPLDEESKRHASFMNEHEILVEVDTDVLDIVDEPRKYQTLVVDDKEMSDDTHFTGFEVMDSNTDHGR